MHRFIGLLTLLAVGACGGDGGSDITNPPEGQFSLTVSGTGTGSGNVTTAAGVSPALACTLDNGQSSGVCGANYAEGTAVTVTVAPDVGSTFGGWSGDASSCATTLTCALTMTTNRTAVAQLTAAPAGGAVAITSSAFYFDPDFFGAEGALIWVVEVQNPTSQEVEVAEVTLTSRDAAGTVLTSDFNFVGPIPPGETRAIQSISDLLGTEATVDFQIGEVEFATEPSNLAAAQIVSSNWRVDQEFEGEGAIVWTVEVQNTTAAEIEEVEVDFVTYDASGKVVAADKTFVGPIPAGAKMSAESFADLHGNEASVRFQVTNVL
jgi:List-Bact-rpt repeat protein